MLIDAERVPGFSLAPPRTFRIGRTGAWLQPGTPTGVDNDL
jgi:hypothetical protein